MTFDGATRIHLIGIGGAGMSAIAKVLLERGCAVSGSDLKPSRAIARLEAMGAGITIGHDPESIEGADVVIASTAIPATDPELERARALGVRVMGRGEALAEVLAGVPSIVVAGTHGKTTTTSMITSILRSDGRDPTYLIGGGLNDAGTNARAGREDIAVAESDESDGSFLLLDPWIGVVTNVEAEHLEHWGSLDRLEEAFDRFVAGIVPGGCAVLPCEDERRVSAARSAGLGVVTFGTAGDVRARSIHTAGSETSFSLVHDGSEAPVTLRVPGLHNVANALAAAAACTAAGVGRDAVAEGLCAYRGVERRFQLRGRQDGVTVIDDYAHHPTEVKATLAAARAGAGSSERVVAVFQPHRYSRTAALHHEFGAAFGDADRIVITDVYGAGEQAVPGVTGKLIADAVSTSLPRRPLAYLPHRSELLDYLEAAARAGDAVLTLGAGDISAVGDELLERLARRSARAGETRR
ncbi:MAG: UDP-N-acetylmuramate--L-alanine ligase [Actinomycetota bacterium]